MRANKGNVALMVALSMTALLGFAAISIDIGYGRLVQQQLQNAGEAGARAGSLRLDGTDAGLDDARATAIEIAAMNAVVGEPVIVDDTDIVLGIWDAENESFIASDDPELVDTVQVRTRLDSLVLFVAPVAFARDTIPVSAASRVRIVSSGAGAVSCFLPLAIPDCLVDRSGVNGLQNLTLRLNSAGVDNVGWGRPNGHPSSSWVRGQLDDCNAEGEVTVGTPIGLNNGVISSAISELDLQIEGSSTRWSTTKWGALPARPSNSKILASRYGNTYEGPIMVFDGGSSYCTGKGGSFNGQQPLVGFVWAAVYDITGNGAKTNLSVRIDTSSDHDYGTAGGGPDYAVIFRAPQMVRSD